MQNDVDIICCEDANQKNLFSPPRTISRFIEAVFHSDRDGPTARFHLLDVKRQRAKEL
jgi:hypothetical protein